VIASNIVAIKTKNSLPMKTNFFRSNSLSYDYFKLNKKEIFCCGEGKEKEEIK